MDAHRHHDLGPVCNGEAGKDHNKSGKKGLQTRAAGRVFIAVTITIGHRMSRRMSDVPVSFLALPHTATNTPPTAQPRAPPPRTPCKSDLQEADLVHTSGAGVTGRL